LVALVASVGVAGCGFSSSHAPAETTAPTPQALAAFFASPQGASFAAMFGRNAGTHDCRFIPGGPPGQREMHGRCRTTVEDNGDGTETVTLYEGWDGGQHVWVFRLAASDTVTAVSSSGDLPPQLRR